MPSNSSDNQSRLTDKLCLYLDTTSSVLQVGLSVSSDVESSHHRVIASHRQPCDSHRYHSALITPAIEALLKEHSLTVSDLGGLVVNRGPGSFTGIRTGMVTARTLAQFLPLTVYMPNTFEVMLWQAIRTQRLSPESPVAIFIDALRGRAYHACLQFQGQSIRYITPPELTLLTEKPVMPTPRRVSAAQPDLRPLTLSSGCQSIVASSTLQKYLEPSAQAKGIACSFISELELDSPVAMAGLLNQFGDSLRISWADALPLYIQEPSVTLKAKP